jgi:hypothetical protein
MLCPVHHGAVHRDEWVISGDVRGRLHFRRPGMRPMPECTGGDIEQVIAQLAEQQRTEPFRPGSTGDPLHLDYAVSVFFHNEEVAAMQLHRESVGRTQPADETVTGTPFSAMLPDSGS